MKVRTVFILALMALLVFLSSNTVYSQDETPTQSTVTSNDMTQEQTVASALDVKQEPETQWVWGEVVTVDLQNNMVFVKYLDYESDQEKEIEIGVGDNTTYDNVNSVTELKPKDTVSIDYISLDGKNIAKNISVEKPEALSEPQAVQTPAMETKPEDLTPATQIPEEPQAQEPQPSAN
jgi:hypothetical protein